MCLEGIKYSCAAGEEAVIESWSDNLPCVNIDPVAYETTNFFEMLSDLKLCLVEAKLFTICISTDICCESDGRCNHVKVE